jgi:hypothetical protein
MSSQGITACRQQSHCPVVGSGHLFDVGDWYGCNSKPGQPRESMGEGGWEGQALTQTRARLGHRGVAWAELLTHPARGQQPELLDAAPLRPSQLALRRGVRLLPQRFSPCQ